MKLLSENLRGELTGSKPQTQLKLHNFNFVDELVNYASIRTGEDLEFTKKGIMSMLEHEICSNLCVNLIDKLAKLRNAFKSNSHSKHSILHFLCSKGESEVIRTLLALRPPVDFNVLDLDGISPAFAALAAGHTDIVKMLFMQDFRPLGPKEEVVRFFHE